MLGVFRAAGHGVGERFVFHGQREHVRAGAQRIGGIELKWREPAEVPTKLLIIERDCRFAVDTIKAQDHALSGTV